MPRVLGARPPGHQHHVALHSALGAILDRGVVDLQAVLDRLHLHTQHQLHTAGLQLRFHEAGDILVQGPQQPVQHLHNGDRNAQAIEEGGEFHADDAATHNDDVLGARGHVQQAGGIHHTGQVHAGNGDPGGAGASGHDQVVAGQVLTAGQMDRLPVRQVAWSANTVTPWLFSRKATPLLSCLETAFFRSMILA